MNAQRAYEMLVSATAYLMVMHGDYEAPAVLAEARINICMDPENTGKLEISTEFSAANLERWWHIRKLERRAP